MRTSRKKFREIFSEIFPPKTISHNSCLLEGRENVLKEKIFALSRSNMAKLARKNKLFHRSGERKKSGEKVERETGIKSQIFVK